MLIDVLPVGATATIDRGGRWERVPVADGVLVALVHTRAVVEIHTGARTKKITVSRAVPPRRSSPRPVAPDDLDLPALTGGAGYHVPWLATLEDRGDRLTREPVGRVLRLR